MRRYLSLPLPAGGLIAESRGDQGRRQAGPAGRHPAGAAVAACPPALDRRPGLVPGGVDHDPDSRLPAHLRRHRHRELGNPEQEVGRAVERIHDPSDARCPRPGCAFFAKHGVVRAPFGQDPGHGGFGGPVHVRDHVRRRRLGVDGSRLLFEAPHQHAARGLGTGQRHRCQLQQERLGARRRHSEDLGDGRRWGRGQDASCSVR